MLNDNGCDRREWDFRYLEWLKKEMRISRSLIPRKPLMKDRNILYLHLPSPGVRGIMLEYDIGRKQAEEWWKIH